MIQGNIVFPIVVAWREATTAIYELGAHVSLHGQGPASQHAKADMNPRGTHGHRTLPLSPLYRLSVVT